MTELSKLNRNEIANQLKNMETEQLFAELEDTIQLDIAKLSTSEWVKADTKVYLAIINELRDRMNRA